MDDLEEFESSWQLADGLGWGVPSSQASRSCDDLALVDASEEEMHPENTEGRRRRKGKGKEVLHHTSSTLVYADPPVVHVPYSSTDDWVEESKSRKAWWRSLVHSSSPFGQMFAILPRVSSA